jgi:integrase
MLHPSDVIALDEDRAMALVSGLQGSTLGAPVHFTLLTALRRSKLLGLKWNDIDFDGRVVNVRRAVEQIKGSVCAFKDTKTLKSRRGVPLIGEAIELLKAHRAEQNAIKLRTPGYNPEGLIFCNPATGLTWDPGKFSSAFRRAAKDLKIPVTFHGLRHSWATIALRARVPMKLVSDVLGHTTTAFTMDTYQHVLEDMQHEAADRVGEAFAAARKRAL